MDKVFTHGLMVNDMMDSGKKESSTGTEFGKDCEEMCTLVNGKKAKHMDMVFTLGATGIDMKVNGIDA